MTISIKKFFVPKHTINWKRLRANLNRTKAVKYAVINLTNNNVINGEFLIGRTLLKLSGNNIEPPAVGSNPVEDITMRMGNYLSHDLNCRQSDQIWRFIGLWATF